MSVRLPEPTVFSRAANTGIYMYLKHWQRLAIVLSIVWALVGGAYEWSALTSQAHSRAVAEYESCIEIDALTHRLALNECVERASHVLAVQLTRVWRDIAVMVVSPIAVVWIAAYIFLMVRRVAKRISRAAK